METGRDGNIVDNESVPTGSNSYKNARSVLITRIFLIKKIIE